MVPLLTLDIPGSFTAAVLLSTLMIHNLNPGQKLFTEEPGLVYGLFASMFISNVLLAFIGTFGAKIWVKVGYIKKTILYPLIFAFAILGSYSKKKSMFDVGTCLVFGLIGWMFKKYDYPSSPLVLGKLIETNYIQTLMVTGPIGFVQRPLTVILFIISIVAIVYPIIGPKLKERKKKNN